MRPSLAIVLLSSLLAPVAVNASDIPTSSQPVRVTTGVTAPVALNAHTLKVSADAVNFNLTPNPAVVVALKINAKGSPEDVHILKSVNPKVDAQVLQAVRDFQFRPATLDHIPVSVDMELTVLVQR